MVQPTPNLHPDNRKGRAGALDSPRPFLPAKCHVTGISIYRTGIKPALSNPTIPKKTHSFESPHIPYIRAEETSVSQVKES